MSNTSLYMAKNETCERRSKGTKRHGYEKTRVYCSVIKGYLNLNGVSEKQKSKMDWFTIESI